MAEEPPARKRLKAREEGVAIDIDEREWHRLLIIAPEPEHVFVLAGMEFDELIRTTPDLKHKNFERVFSETDPGRLGLFIDKDSCYSSKIDNPRIAWALKALGVDLLDTFGFSYWKDVHTFGYMIITGPERKGLTCDEIETLRSALKSFNYNRDPTPIKI